VPISPQELHDLNLKCLDIRHDIIEMIHTAGSGHPGGSLSCVEILTALYFHVMWIKPDQPHWEERDRFILSKGHAAPGLYAVLAERGYFPVSELATFSAPGTRLQKHIDMHQLPGTGLSTGSLAQGLSVGVGMALADKMDHKKDRRVFALIGDGESQEGQIWEAALSAAQLQLDNLVVILDNNGCQVDGYTRNICNIEPVHDKWMGFGWQVQRVPGHDLERIIEDIEYARVILGKPHIIIADTIKGKGISFMENKPEWHAQTLSEAQYQQACRELQTLSDQLTREVIH